MGMRVGNALFGIAVSAILARLLDPENLAYYFLIYSVVTICSNLVRGGQGAAAIRLIAEAEALGRLGRGRQTARFTLFGVLVIALLFSLTYYLYLGELLFTRFFDSPAAMELSGLIAVWIVIVGLRSQIAFIFRGMHAVRLAATFNGFISTLATLVLFLFLYARQATPHLGDVVVFSIAGATIGLLVSLVFLRARLRNFKGDGSIRVSEIGTIAWPLFLIALTNMLLTQGDMVLVGSLFDQRDIAFYGVALRLKGMVVLQMFVLGTVLSPVIAKLYAQKEKLRLEKIMRLVSTLAVVPFALIIIILLLVGESFVAWIFGETYRGAYPILMILLGGLFVSAASGSGQQLMMMTGHERILLPIRVIGGLCAILGGLLAAPGMGIIGVALAFSLSTAGVNIVITLTAKKLTGISCYILAPSYFMNTQNRRAIMQELRGLIRDSLTRGNSKGHRIVDGD